MSSRPDRSGTLQRIRHNRRMSLESIRYRPATPRDAAVTAELMNAGFATYREFAGPEWQPRPAIREEPEIHDRLSRGDVHARLAIDPDGALAGFTGWLPALDPSTAQRIPGRAHLWTLFVAQAWWGTGLARELHAWSVGGMRDSGFETAQLWTPLRHTRARAFYEREGWSASEERQFSPILKLDLILYERPLRERAPMR